MRNYLSTIILLLLFSLQTPAWGASEEIVLTDDVQMSLGDAFMAEGDYYRAITEYKKLTFLFPDSERLSEALYQIGMAYYKGKDYKSAVNHFAKVRKAYTASNYSSAAFYEGLSYSKLDRHDDAALAFERSRLFDESHPDAANAQLGLCLNSLEVNDVAGCRQQLEEFAENYPQDERVPEVRKSFALLDAYEAQPKKSPGLAGTMSAVIPGSGQMYAEHYKDGLMAFVVNGLFIAGALASLDDENYALAAIVGGVGLPFYVGNIYGAANATRKWNLSLSRRLRDDLSISLNYHY
jgi:tetratricopeptide (TPR) repeat protein